MAFFLILKTTFILCLYQAVEIQNVTSTTTFTSTTSSETKFKTDKLKVNSVSDSATRGIIEVGKVTTSSGGLTLDSALGTVTVADNLVVDGTGIALHDKKL